MTFGTVGLGPSVAFDAVESLDSAAGLDAESFAMVATVALTWVRKQLGTGE